MDVKYPEIDVQLTGGDGNAFAIIGAVTKALRSARTADGQRIVSQEEIAEFQREATSGDYDNVLATAMRWVDVS